MDEALKKPTKRRARKADGIVCIIHSKIHIDRWALTIILGPCRYG